MDVATRKRVMSSNLDGPAAKVQASMPEPPPSFSDLLFLNTLNGLNVTEPSQRLPFIEDIISRLQWLKQYYQQNEPFARRPPPPDKSPNSREPHKSLDHQQMKKCLEKDREMLSNMSKMISLAAQGPPILPPKMMPPPPPPPPVVQIEVKKTTAPTTSVTATISATPSQPPAPPPVLTPQQPKKQVEKKVVPQQSPPPQYPFNPARFAQNAEEMMLDLQEKQRKLLSYISAAHGGKVTDEVLHDYLRHPFVLLKENGTVRKQQNPFYHLMAQNPQMKMMGPNPSVILKPENSKPTTPIPAPPVLLPQVELPMNIKKESSPSEDKVSPPPQLPLQVPFAMPVTRKCNQWSVVSMALPLRLLCRCFQTPCRCQPMPAM
uniref:QLQ domain-containing protein n=1 Tax=Caenorhabditis tropicalis TaxID=1561998 RepID=A0A1I7SZ15_9PELO